MRAILLSILIFGLGSALIVFNFSQRVLAPISFANLQLLRPEDKIIESDLNRYEWKIDRGNSHNTVFRKLHDLDVVDSPDIIKIFAKYNDIPFVEKAMIIASGIK